MTPLVWDHWQSMMADHPDRNFVNYVLGGIRNGFRTGCVRSISFTSARRNMRSALEHPEVVREYLEKEVQRGVLLGPFERGTIPGVVVSRFGVIPKGGRLGRWRLIVDFSHPDGKSINDGIAPEWCSLTYVKVDDVVRRLLEIGANALMAKIDVKSAYRIVPVHPGDRRLLAMEWDGKIFVDAALPFGLRSAPKIFNALADAVEWMVKQFGSNDVWHYLDDFIVCGAEGTGDCASSLQLLRDLCDYLGIPLAEEKVEGPTTRITFLGFERHSGRTSEVANDESGSTT